MTYLVLKIFFFIIILLNSRIYKCRKTFLYNTVKLLHLINMKIIEKSQLKYNLCIIFLFILYYIIQFISMLIIIIIDGIITIYT
jgi:hypothetical protein